MKRIVLVLSAVTLIGIAVAYAACGPGGPASPDGTTIPPATQITASDGSGWTIVSGEADRNLSDTGQPASILTILNGSVIYAKDPTGNWHVWQGWQPTSDPNSYTVPANITSAFLSANFHPTFSDGFAVNLPTICLNSTFSASCNWFNGVEQCCMSPVPQPGNVGGAMFPTSVGANGPYNPYSNASGGGLLMTMHTETTTDATHTFTSVFSGVMTTIAGNGQGFLQQFGYFEATMWVSPNVGTWPAFWMLSPSKNMEIDIIEQYGHDPNHYWGTVSDYGIPISQTNRHPMEFPSVAQNLTTGYHQYGLLWDFGHVSFYLDRALQWSIATPPDAKQPMYLLLDQGSGGGWPTCAGPSQVGVSPPVAGTSCTGTPSDSTTQLEGAKLLVQSVNVWQHN